MPCVESIGSDRCKAVTTSSSVTFSHLHTTFCLGSADALSGFAEGFRPFQPSFGRIIGARLGLNRGFASSSKPALSSRRTTSNAMAGLPARPGESMPAVVVVVVVVGIIIGGGGGVSLRVSERERERET